MIIFISCAKQKRDSPCFAKDMYISTLFKKMYRYAKSLNPDSLYILSAKYGVLSPNDVIEPYDVTLKKLGANQKKDWARMVKAQLDARHVNYNEEAVFLRGKSYRENISRLFRKSYAPLAKLRIGKQLEFLDKNVRKPQ